MYYEREAERCIADLGIGDLRFAWEFVPAKYVDAKKKWVGSHAMSDGVHTIRIAMRYGDDKERIKTVLHELRHAWQFARGICVRLPTGRYTWLGSEFIGPRINYRRVGGKARLLLAEEVDARGYEETAYARLFEGVTGKKVFVNPQNITRVLVRKAMEAYK